MKKIVPRDNPCYCINVRRAANILTKFYDKALEPVNLTISQFSLLNDIKLLKTCNKIELARCTRLDRTTIIRNLNILRARGLIMDIPGTNNRNTLVQLTDLGESTIAEGMSSWKQAQDQVKSTIGLDGIENLKQILAKIALLT